MWAKKFFKTADPYIHLPSIGLGFCRKTTDFLGERQTKMGWRGLLTGWRSFAINIESRPVCHKTCGMKEKKNE
jgi:hypothetical protein